MGFCFPELTNLSVKEQNLSFETNTSMATFILRTSTSPLIHLKTGPWTHGTLSDPSSRNNITPPEAQQQPAVSTFLHRCPVVSDLDLVNQLR